MSTYQLSTISDLLRIPSDRRAECFKELEIALQLHELAFGDAANKTPIETLTWVDDGDASASIKSTDGEDVLSLHVSKGTP